MPQYSWIREYEGTLTLTRGDLFPPGSNPQLRESRKYVPQNTYILEWKLDLHSLDSHWAKMLHPKIFWTTFHTEGNKRLLINFKWQCLQHIWTEIGRSCNVQRCRDDLRKKIPKGRKKEDSWLMKVKWKNLYALEVLKQISTHRHTQWEHVITPLILSKNSEINPYTL